MTKDELVKFAAGKLGLKVRFHGEEDFGQWIYMISEKINHEHWENFCPDTSWEWLKKGMEVAYKDKIIVRINTHVSMLSVGGKLVEPFDTVSEIPGAFWRCWYAMERWQEIEKSFDSN